MIRRKWWEDGDLLDLELGNGYLGWQVFSIKMFSLLLRGFFLFVLFLMVGAASTIRIKLLRDPPLFRPGNVSRPLHVTLFNWC